MNVLPAGLLAVAAGLAVLAARRQPALAAALGLGGLASVIALAYFQVPGARGVLGGVELVVTEFERTFLLLGAIGAIVACAATHDATGRSDLASTALLGLGGASFGLAATDPAIGLVIVAGAWLGTLPAVTAAAPGSNGLASSGADLRIAGITAVFAVLAGAIAPDPFAALGLEPATMGLVAVLLVGTVAIGLGATPFHRRTTLLAAIVPVTVLPAVVVPATLAFSAVAAIWLNDVISTSITPLDIERQFLVLAGLAGVAGGGLIAFTSRDLRRFAAALIGYQAGFVVLGMTAAVGRGPETLQGWLVISLILAFGVGAWAGALEGVMGSTRTDDLAGWVRKAPLLAVAFVILGGAAVGWPGTLVFESRADLLEASLGPGWRVVGLGAVLCWLVPAGRVLLVGLAPGRADTGRDAGWARLPSTRDRLGDATGRPAAGSSPVTRIRSSVRPDTVAALGSLLVALMALGVAAGGLGAAEAATSGPPEVVRSPSPRPSASPPGTQSPPASASPDDPNGSPGATP